MFGGASLPDGSVDEPACPHTPPHAASRRDSRQSLVPFFPELHEGRTVDRPAEQRINVKAKEIRSKSHRLTGNFRSFARSSNHDQVNTEGRGGRSRDLSPPPSARQQQQHEELLACGRPWPQAPRTEPARASTTAPGSRQRTAPVRRGARPRPSRRVGQTALLLSLLLVLALPGDLYEQQARAR